MTILAAAARLLAEAGNPITIGGLPLHPLVVHAVVVLLPLGVLGLIAVIVKPSWRQHYGWLAMGALGLGAAFAVIAAQTGEELMVVTGVTEDHQRLGKLMGAVAVVTFVAGAAWFWSTLGGKRRTDRSVLGTGVQPLLAIASLLLAVVSLGMIAAVGHSGATMVWQAKLAAAAQQTPAAAASASAASTSFTMAQVKSHATPSDCWTAINGNAYDVTQWISRHPGGQSVIKGLCGIDGTAAFNGQHGNQGGPNGMLQQYLLGKLG